MIQESLNTDVLSLSTIPFCLDNISTYYFLLTATSQRYLTAQQQPRKLY